MMDSSEGHLESLNEGEKIVEDDAEGTAAPAIEGAQETVASESVEVGSEPESEVVESGPEEDVAASEPESEPVEIESEPEEGAATAEAESVDVKSVPEEDVASSERESELVEVDSEPEEGADTAEPEMAEVESEPVEETAAPEPESAEVESESDEEIVVPEEVVERPEGTSWYVVHSYSGYENKVRKNLLQRIESMEMGDQIFDVIVPTEEEVEIKDGHRRIYKKRVFPGYILVEMLLTENSWYVVRNTPGVTGFVGSGNEPTPLRQNEVDKIINRMEVETPTIRVGFREGQTVRITDGPFSDFMGTVDEIFLDRGKVRVLVSMFGRETPIELDFLQVEKL
jgi:transcriptional antiterminator NusG